MAQKPTLARDILGGMPKSWICSKIRLSVGTGFESTKSRTLKSKKSIFPGWGSWIKNVNSDPIFGVLRKLSNSGFFHARWVFDQIRQIWPNLTNLTKIPMVAGTARLASYLTPLATSPNSGPHDSSLRSRDRKRLRWILRPNSWSTTSTTTTSREVRSGDASVDRSHVMISDNAVAASPAMQDQLFTTAADLTSKKEQDSRFKKEEEKQHVHRSSCNCQVPSPVTEFPNPISSGPAITWSAPVWRRTPTPERGGHLGHQFGVDPYPIWLYSL